MKKSEEFVKQLINIRDYWLKQSEDKEEVVNGFIFSMLTMLDGRSSINDFHVVELKDCRENKTISGVNDECLHDIFSRIDKEDIK